jgi:hypothetical protein
MAASTVDWSQISLFRATPAQIIESRKLSHVEWSQGLSMEAYLERDARLDDLEHAKDGRLTTWYVNLLEHYTHR